jgi:prepilin-type N-terminal cleavage/methylation domain-containing protein
MHMRRRGFSLVEILVVIAIIALLVSMMLPVIAHLREKAKWAVCISNLRTMGLAIHAYANDYHGTVPYMYPTWTAMEPLKMDWQPIGLGLLLKYDYIIQGDMLVFRAPTDGPTSVLRPNQWLTGKHVCGDYQYWQHRFPEMFTRKAHETILVNLERSLIVTDQVGCQDWEGFNFRANHANGIHYLGGNVTVDFLRYDLGQGIPNTVSAWAELKVVVNQMETLLENK